MKKQTRYKFRFNDDLYTAKDLFQDIDGYNDQIDDFMLGYENGNTVLTTDSVELYQWLIDNYSNKGYYLEHIMVS